MKFFHYYKIYQVWVCWRMVWLFTSSKCTICSSIDSKFYALVKSLRWITANTSIVWCTALKHHLPAHFWYFKLQSEYYYQLASGIGDGNGSHLNCVIIRIENDFAQFGVSRWFPNYIWNFWDGWKLAFNQISGINWYQNIKIFTYYISLPFPLSFISQCCMSRLDIFLHLQQI